MKKLAGILLILITVNSQGQTYTHPTTGMAGEYIGSCMTATCSGTYTDDNGGGAGNYSNSVNGIYRTFCPNAPGQCIRVCFNSINFNVSNCIPGNVPCDVLYVEDGPTQNSPLIYVLDYTDNGTIPCFTASGPSGCLTFRFFSSSANNAPGWNATISCVTCSANTTTDNNDCISATAICSNASFSGASIGPGTSSEGCAGCNTSEHFTNWYKFCAQTSGVLQFTIDPTNNTQDYDFALYGPNVTCTSLGTPIRCSYAAGSGNTGLRSAASDNSEDVSGDGWVSPLNVIAGQCYYLMISQWSAGGSGFTIDFTGSTTSLNCIVLPIELLSFNASQEGQRVQLQWVTASESDNDYFTVERSADAFEFSEIAKVSGAGNSHVITSYLYFDDQPLPGTSYYRLKQTDYNGNFTYSNTLAISMIPVRASIFLVPNPTVGKFDVVYYSKSKTETTIWVTDMKGIHVFESNQPAKEGTNRFSLDLSSLEPGIFTVILFNDQEILEKRLEKQ